MTWVKFEHRTPLNRKVAGLSDQAFRTWFNMTCWCVGEGTDGFISAAVPLHLFVSGRGSKGVVNELANAGLIEHVHGGMEVHDFTDYQLSGAEQKQAREAAAKRQREARARRLNGRNTVQLDDDVVP